MHERKGAMNIYCCQCEIKIEARLTDGAEIYPHRPDLKPIPFWRCDTCGNYIGCHHKTDKPTNPLGIIPTPELRAARRHIHKLIDPAWENGLIKRNDLYAELTERLGWEYHTAKIRSVKEAREVYRLARDIINEIHQGSV